MDGGTRSEVHVMVLEVVAVLPQPSIAVNVLVCVCVQVFFLMISGDPTFTLLHYTMPFAFPNAALISEAAGLQPSVVVVPVAVMDGGTRSEVHVMVLAVVDVLPQASLAVNVLVCVCVHVPVTGLSVDDTVGVPHASVAVAVPNAALISEAAGLQPSVVVVPVAVMDGGTRSEVHVMVLAVVAVLPQASLAVNVLVCVCVEVLVTGLSVDDTVGVPHASVAVAVPNAALISEAAGLQPSVVVVPVAVMDGGTRSEVQVMVLAVVAVLPQPSIAVNVLVCVCVHVPVTGLSVDDTVGVPHASVAVAVPNAALISEAAGLQPSVVVVPVAVMDGGTRSEVHVMVLAVVEVLPQPSLAVNVLVCVCVHVPVTGLSVDDTVGVPHASVAVAVPNAALISEAAGLQPSVVVVPVAVMDGGTRSVVHVMVLEVVAVLLQPSIAVNVLVCVCVHVPVTGLSVDDTVGVPHASVAVAVPNAALISEAAGLHPSVVVLPVAVIDGGTRSEVQVMVLAVVAVLPQPSIAVNVLVCDCVHVPVTGLSVDDTVGVPHASVAVAVPNAALISEAAGLQPSVVVVPVAVMDGGTRSEVQVMVLAVVAVLPQPSIAVNVLVCVCVHVPVTGLSVDDTVGVPHASVAVAVPNAALISEAAGLQPSVVVVPVAVMDGGTRSEVQVMVLAVVAVLPQPSIAVNVLVCVCVHVPVTGLSVDDTVGVPHASVAVAVPNAALISEAAGLQPSVVVVPVAV